MLSDIRIAILFKIAVLTLFTYSENPCTTPDNHPGQCVNIKSCESLVVILRNTKRSETDTQFLLDSKCGGNAKSKNIKVCCKRNNNSQPLLLNSTILSTLIPNEYECGLSLQDKLVGGNVTSIDEFPWTALLEFESESTKRKKFMCGGVLITERYVLTAAHCARQIRGWKLTGVRLGEWNITSDPDCIKIDEEVICNEPHQDVPIETTIIHPKYFRRTHMHDIALLRLVKNVKFIDSIRPICLIGGKLAPDLIANDFDNQLHYVSGWGKTETGESSAVKLKVRIPIVNRTYCASKYENVRVTIRDNQLCAGGEQSIDSCNGDSGGPMMRVFNEEYGSRWFLTGIVSFGRTQCGKYGWPGVYTRVASYYNWIDSNIKP